MRWPWTRRLLSRQELGALGERHAARQLRAKGHKLLEANYRTKSGEIDLITRDGDILVFTEVRSRSDENFLSPRASVTPEKQERIMRTAQNYLRQRNLTECHIRFDIVEVMVTPNGHVRELRHLEAAFIGGTF